MSLTSASGGATQFTSNLTKDKLPLPEFVEGGGDDGMSDIASSIHSPRGAAPPSRKNSGDAFRFTPASPIRDDQSGASDETEKSPRKKIMDAPLALGDSPRQKALDTSLSSTLTPSPRRADAKPGGGLETSLTLGDSPRKKGLDISLSSSAASGSPRKMDAGRRLRTRRRRRVPGGAAAKLVGKSTVDEGEDEEPEPQDYGEVKAPIGELDQLRAHAKNEFSVGPTTNRRYHLDESKAEEDASTAKESVNDNLSDVSLPSYLSRSEAFHENAAKAVMSLISPKSSGPRSAISNMSSIISNSNKSATGAEDGSTIGSGGNGSGAAMSVIGPLQLPTSSAFMPPPREDVMSMASVATSLTGIDHGAFESKARSPIEKPLLTKRAEQVVEDMSKSMRDPSKTLSDLLAAIATPDNETERNSRGYMVRRKNACGALQVLTAKKVHRIQICWTVGVLPALTSVLEDILVGADPPTRLEFVEARKRAVASLMNLSVPIENRLAIFHSPQLVPSLVQVIDEDRGEARRGSCAVLAYLAKTTENRLLMVQVPGLLDALANVIKPAGVRRKRKKKKRPDASNDSTTDGSETGGDFGMTSGEDDDDDSSTDSSDSEDDDDGSDKMYGASTGDASTAAGFSFASEDRHRETFGTELSVSYLSESADRASARYAADPTGFLRGARQNVFAILGHLVKEKDNGYHLARHKMLTDTLVAVSKLHGSDFHAMAVKVLANLTRHRSNSKIIVFKLQNVVPAFVAATKSDEPEARKHACFGIQNLAQDKPCRQELAITPGLLAALCYRARKSIDPEERLSSIHALKNLTDEPANLIPMSNTPECFATLMQIAHASDDSVTEMMQYLGCDALATLSHWFRSIATSGKRHDVASKRHLSASKELFVPTLKIVTYESWQ